MFMVGGGILVHGLPGSHDVLHGAAEAVRALPGLGGPLAALTPTILNALAGMVAGALVLAAVVLARGILAKFGRPA
jgi:predicted DNA repair protein MutK